MTCVAASRLPLFENTIARVGRVFQSDNNSRDFVLDRNISIPDRESERGRRWIHRSDEFGLANLPW